MPEVENIKPYEQRGSKREQVEQMFDAIAPAYDFMNHAMTLGIDRLWRRRAVNRLKEVRPEFILDLATGTGDFAIKLCRTLHPRRVLGIDLSQGMLDVATAKAKRHGLDNVIAFQQADCLDLPVDDNSADAVTIAFGVRNFEDIARGYREMYRVLKPGGRLSVLELSVPTNSVIRWFYNLYTLHIIPFFGAMKSGDKEAYRYLPRSIAAVPQGHDMLALMRAADFGSCRFSRMTFGTCTLYEATK